MIATNTDGIYSSLIRLAQSWATVYLPISPHSVLVAKRSELDRELGPSEVNRASACLSESHFYASGVSEEERILAPTIGSLNLFLQTQNSTKSSRQPGAHPRREAKLSGRLALAPASSGRTCLSSRATSYLMPVCQLVCELLQLREIWAPEDLP
jgi:hypothetical protein